MRACLFLGTTNSERQGYLSVQSFDLWALVWQLSQDVANSDGVLFGPEEQMDDAFIDNLLLSILIVMQPDVNGNDGHTQHDASFETDIVLGQPSHVDQGQALEESFIGMDLDAFVGDDEALGNIYPIP